MLQTAMIFAAGLGTRLAPFTQDRPKALVELNGKTLLQHCADKLCRAGVKRLVINIHHFPEMMRQAIVNLHCPGAEVIISDESELLLDTGGGLLKAASHLKDSGPFLLHNVDVLSDIDLHQMYAQHQQSGALATLAVSQRTTSRYFLWDNQRLCGWENVQTGKEIICFPAQNPQHLAFSGIHIVNPEVFDFMEEQGVFSINQVYLRLAAMHPVMSYVHDARFWADLGTPEKLARAEDLLRQHPQKF